MTVNFLYNNDSFENDGRTTLEEIYTKIDKLDALKVEIDDINEKKKKLGIEKDKIFKDFAIYDKNIYNNLTVSDFINNYTEVKHDYKILLGSIINKSGNLDGENIDGQIGLFEFDNTLIFNIENLISFYYKNFENLEDGHDFFNGIRVHFPKLHLHDHVNDSLIEIQDDLKPFSEMIVRTLIYLNNCLKESFKRHRDVRKTLKELTESIGIHSSVQGKNKEMLNFTFTTKDEKKIIKCCDPHVKFNRSNESGIEKEYYRLYFHTGDDDIENGKVLIGHIGIHLGEKKSK